MAMHPIWQFFANSESLDYCVLRPLSHINGNWDTTWDFDLERYKPEEDSFSEQLNELIDELSACLPPVRYHDNEDRLAEYVRDHSKWPIRKVGGRWIGIDYFAVLQEGSFSDFNQLDLIEAAAGRIKAAIDRGQSHFDDMEDSHKKMLAFVLSMILYQRG